MEVHQLIVLCILVLPSTKGLQQKTASFGIYAIKMYCEILPHRFASK